MARWITNEIMNDILAEVNNPESPMPHDTVVQSHGQPSEICTEQIAVRFPTINNEAILITGFDDVHYEEIRTPDNYGIEKVEVRTQSSDDMGGLQSTDRDVCIAYGIICCILAQRGFTVVPNMHNFF